jgi:Fe-Mn family superoxide dismutase
MSVPVFQLPELPYDVHALEPVISGKIMTLHHKGHHQAYVTNLNKALVDFHAAEVAKDDQKMTELLQAIKFNGGGNINHTIFWTILAPKGSHQAPGGALASMIEANFGSFQKFKELMTQKAVGLQGSGWAWLGFNKALKRLEVATCANQDPLSTVGLVPLLGIDVWEHAYYLDYENKRAAYVEAIWQIFHWKAIEERFKAAQG